MLLAATAVFRPARLRAISAIEAAVGQWPEMRAGVHRLGGIGFSYRGKESSHIHGNGLLDCFVGCDQRDALITEGRALSHHVFPQSGWVSFWVEDENDIGPALDLIRMAASHPSTK